LTCKTIKAGYVGFRSHQERYRQKTNHKTVFLVSTFAQLMQTAPSIQGSYIESTLPLFQKKLPVYF